MNRMGHTRRRHGRLMGGVLLLLLAPLSAAARDPEPAPAGPLSLGACIRLALENQPALAARRASLAAAESHHKSVADSKMPILLMPDLPVRRQQAVLLVEAVRAALCQAECDAIRDVSRAYLTYLYFQTQYQIYADAVAATEAREAAIRHWLTEGERPDVLPRHLEKVGAALKAVRARQAEAEQGRERARLALGEQLGKGPNFAVELVAATLPYPEVTLLREEVLAQAQTGRGEMVQAIKFAELAALEIEAQGAIRRLTAKTFASHLDPPAPPSPADLREQRPPPALVPEMPPSLSGSRSARVERATALHLRSEAVVEKTRGQVVREAEAAYLKWQEEARKLSHFRRAADQAAAALATAEQDFANRKPSVQLDEILASQTLATQLRMQLAESLYQYDLCLANLQRVTGCAFRPGFEAELVGEVVDSSK